MTTFETDSAIAGRQVLRPIEEIGASLGLDENDLVQYGPFKAKIRFEAIERIRSASVQDAPLVLVSATNPTKAGEGKTTCSIGLTQALRKLGKNATVVLREPSMGPVFGRKGGAAGGGYSQVLPMEDINLHFTGDIHAIAAANNLIAAVLDSELYFGSDIGVDGGRVLWKRVLDMNDRALRDLTVHGSEKGTDRARRTGFDITAASEVMAILCLSRGYDDLKAKLSSILLGFRSSGEALFGRDLGVEGAAAALLKDAMLPNLVQTLEHGPALVHGGPFANIAQGANTVLATQTAMKLSEYVVTEAGFGFDLGGEKFFDIVSPYGGFKPSLVVLVATARSLKLHGGVRESELAQPNPEAVRHGGANLEKHIENVRKFGVEPVVCINRFPSDTDEELRTMTELCEAADVKSSVATFRQDGGDGGTELAGIVVDALAGRTNPARTLYDWKQPVETKIETIAKEIYGADGVEYTSEGKAALEVIDRNGFGDLPICMAKTEKSLSDDANLLGRPRGFTVTVRDIVISAGSGFLVPLTGKTMRMPGLPAKPAARSIDITDQGAITGLF